jgi:hypothetical protein
VSASIVEADREHSLDDDPVAAELVAYAHDIVDELHHLSGSIGPAARSGAPLFAGRGMSGLTPAPTMRVHDPSGVVTHGVALRSAGESKFRYMRDSSFVAIGAYTTSWSLPSVRRFPPSWRVDISPIPDMPLHGAWARKGHEAACANAESAVALC